MAIADMAAQSLPRMSKLNYKNPLPAHDMSLTPWPSQNIHNSELQQTYNTHRTPATAPSPSPSPNTRSSSDSASSTSPSLASTSSNRGSSHESKSKKKTKSNSVFGFLSLKEPSQLALEQLAEQQRNPSNKPSPSSSAACSFTGKKLPASVPKVNSKWDGVPDKFKTRDSGSSHMSRDRSSTLSRKTQGSQSTSTPWLEYSGSMTRNYMNTPPNTIASSTTSGSNLSTYQNHPSVTSSTASVVLPETSWYVTDENEPMASGALPPDSPRADSFYGTVAKSLPSPPESRFDLGPSSDESSDVRSVSPSSSTGSVDTIVRDTAEFIFNELNHRPHRGLWIDNESTVRMPTGRVPDAVPESHDFLFNPQSTAEQQVNNLPIASPSTQHYTPTRSVQNFSRPMLFQNNTSPTPSPRRPSVYRKAPLTSALPTLYELSLASTESLETVRDNSDACSIAPSSIAPSELSTQWFDSPRERLGLGGRLRKNDVLPWEKTEDKPKKSRLLMFGRGSAR